jgi:RecB family exonuclease
LVADLRRTLVDPDAQPALRDAAARRLARLAHESSGDRALVPAADPASWWGTRELTRADVPIRPADQPVVVSASTLAGLIDCPAKWFLEREAGGASKSSQAQGFGNILHVLADHVATGKVAGDLDALMEEVDRVWGRLSFRTPWSGERERREMAEALGRFLAWQAADRGRTFVASEAEFTATLTLPDGQQVTLFGYADRLEIDTEGRVVVVDLKTGKYPPSDKSIAENPQLGLYQLAVEQGGFGHLLPEGAKSGGAELWQLRKSTYGKLKVQEQPPLAPGPDGHTVIESQLMSAVRALRDEALEVRPGPICDRCAFQRLCPTKQSGTVLT